jgi:hypothetical protein
MCASAVTELAAAEQSPHVAAALFERTVEIWDLQTGKRISSLDTILSIGGERLALHPNGRQCVAASVSIG